MERCTIEVNTMKVKKRYKKSKIKERTRNKIRKLKTQ